MPGEEVPEEIRSFLENVTNCLRPIEGIKAITLGGSWATGTQRADSDVDVGLYYRADDPIDLAALRGVAVHLNDSPNPIVTDVGGFGRWNNGGAPLTIAGRRVDLIYRDLDVVSSIMDECEQGAMQLDHYANPPYGFRNYIYLAEVKFAIVLDDPEEVLKPLKQRVVDFPEPLRIKMIQAYLWEADFSIQFAVKFARRGDTILVAGCMTRVVSDIIQVVYAVNAAFFSSEKKFYRDAETFAVMPADLVPKLNRLVHPLGDSPAELMATVERAASLFDELVELARQRGVVYRPKF